ncbi:MAG TPA: FimV/HubP family polar landmark protein [Nitrosomonas sp.]|nr:FimV/HubP family polar landmark protein [Nitrosomonas sp.]
MAKAYLEMEDKEGAREMLEEVVQEGDDNQQKTATELLEKL